MVAAILEAMQAAVVTNHGITWQILCHHFLTVVYPQTLCFAGLRKTFASERRNVRACHFLVISTETHQWRLEP
jgi:hypothetical protein